LRHAAAQPTVGSGFNFTLNERRGYAAFFAKLDTRQQHGHGASCGRFQSGNVDRGLKIGLL
jgi:hypothetical protein